MDIFDSHTHINSSDFKNDEIDAINRAKAMGVSSMLVIAYDEKSTESLFKLLDQKEVYGGVGIHPDSALIYDEKWLLDKLRHPKVKVLGEIGLDYHNDVNQSVQKEVFRRQIELSQKLNLPISVHCRDALADTYEILKEMKVNNGVMHSFNGNFEWMEKFLKLGMFLSFSGVVTYKNAKEVMQTAKLVPLEKMLIETDAPYLTPMPFRARKNEPAFVRYVLEFIAKQRKISSEKLAKITSNNARNLFKI